MTKGIVNGHPVYFDQEQKLWLYLDSGERVDKIADLRNCPYCDQPAIGGQDNCIVNLQGVQAACCGHGRYEGYILFEDGTMITGRFFVSGRKG